MEYEVCKLDYNHRIGKKTIDERWEYTGELDDNGLACGHGVATHGNKQYKGTWFADKRHGIGKNEIQLAQFIPSITPFRLMALAKSKKRYRIKLLTLSHLEWAEVGGLW